ncbi:ATP12 family chaperone protein [Erythrobacter sp. THAF29]|uniref:ATP12 family chaperone protein n=1 Tax=Erythrobacter sp. THAF29 TaxID=2587851 RepID=UPI00126862EC|nr:ATP12 family protein [Erythrobacter sp. THAF29]QFT76984.1 ATP12 chaperone protein [Erythrobacter sp. THAF29]
MKRFYKQVDLRQEDGGWQVALDGRGIKTQAGSQQLVPTETLAKMLAAEWDDQGQEIDPARFVFRDLTDYAIDVVGPGIAAIAAKLVAYGDTDTLLYRADPDEPLYARQQEVWEPIVAGFEAREGITMVRASGIMHKAQDKAALGVLKEKLAALDGFALAGTESMTSLAASLIIGLSATGSETEDEVSKLWDAANLEEEWQADLWGRDEEAEAGRTQRREAFLNAWKFVRAARS